MKNAKKATTHAAKTVEIDSALRREVLMACSNLEDVIPEFPAPLPQHRDDDDANRFTHASSQFNTDLAAAADAEYMQDPTLTMDVADSPCYDLCRSPM